jgi:hypothetical protein
MPAKLGVLVIHGIGSHDENFAEPMKEELIRRISNHDGICWKPVCWATLLLREESKLLDKLFPKGKHPHWFFKWVLRFKLRELVMNGIGDVAAYRSVLNISGHTSHTRQTNTIYDDIHDRVHKCIVMLREELGNADKPLIVIAHSLGSVIMYDYIWDRQQHINEKLYGATPFERMETLTGLITFGSPIPLFTFGYHREVSIKFPPDNLHKDFKGKAKWFNFYDADDVFGWPVKDLKDCVAENKPISVGSIFTRWNILCHGKYWTDNNFTKPVAKYISEILKLCPET